MVTQRPSTWQFLRSWFVGDPMARSFVTGAADVAPWEASWGIGSDTWQPDDLVAYLSRSNAVQACVNARTTALTGLPIKLYSKRKDAAGNRKEVTSGPARDLLDTINPFWTFQRWLEMTEQSICIWGKSYSFYSLKGGKPVELWWVPADRVKVHPHPTDYVSHFTYDPGKGGQPIRFEREETLWIRKANIANQFDGLSPLAASMLSADSAVAAMKSNYLIFKNGLTAAGMVTPVTGSANLTQDQAKTVSDDLNRRFKGVDNAHKVAVLRFPVNIKQLSMTPKDAQFVDMMNLSLEDIARAYAVPIDKVGGKRTYQNVDGSEKAFYSDCIIPEAKFIASEITEQLLSLFGGDMVAEFDDSDIDVLHEAESAKWERWKGQLETGAKTINQYRAEVGDDPVPWGDVAWLDGSKMPIDSPEKPVAPIPPALAANTDDDPEKDPPVKDDPEQERSHRARSMEYDSPEHRERWARQLADQEPWERSIGATTARLLADQKQSILARLRQQRGKREADDVLLEPFDLPRWIRTFRQTMRPIVAGVVSDAGVLAKDELAVDFAFNVQDPNVIRQIETQVQQFAESVNRTTWDLLSTELAEGVAGGESIDQLAGRIERIMGDRIHSAQETIARTETSRAANAGTMESWKQSGVVTGKRWLAALDDRTRGSHISAHGQVVALDDNFRVGAGSGPTPGQIGRASEDINCRCSMEAVLDVEIDQ